MAEIRPLTGDDAHHLVGFSCAGFREPASQVVQDVIRYDLAEAIEMGVACGVGLWQGDDLCGVAAWTVDIEHNVYRSCVLAVRVGRQGRGHGRHLKEHLLSVASAAGARAVASQVHEDNTTMLALNRRFGAIIERDRRDTDYFTCVIPLSG
jgi:ribosomal protein S18 acetylase RimI-like enzyme